MNGRPAGGCGFNLLLLLFGCIALAQCVREAGVNGTAPRVEVRRPPPSDVSLAEEDTPMIASPGDLPAYGIADPGPQRDSQGTAFAIARRGLWLTAEHVVAGCDLVGLETGEHRAERVDRVVASQVSDAALIADGLPSRDILTLSTAVPQWGEDGYHMGFPAGEPAVVHSRFIGQAQAVRAGGTMQPILAWAELERAPSFDHALGGISGGPTLDASGRVIGINSAASERRGRVLTTHPAQALSLLRAARATAEPVAWAPIPDMAAAIARFTALVGSGTIRAVFCDVSR
jgi:S1-C subfamily serine protease